MENHDGRGPIDSVTRGVSLPPSAPPPTARDLEHGRTDSTSRIQDIPRGKERYAFGMGVLLFLTAIAQASLANSINSHGIEVILEALDWFEGYVPTAGDPSPGIVGYVVGASFIMVSFMQQPRRGVRVAIWVVVAWAIIGSLVILFNSRGQLDVYEGLKDYDSCTQNDAKYENPYDENLGDCICRTSDGPYDLEVDIERRARSIICQNIPEYVDDILASYVLTWIILAQMVATIGLHAHRFLCCCCSN